MTINSLLLVLAGLLSLLFILLLYFFLKKDQALAELKGRYDNLLKIESEQFKKERQRDDYVAMMVHELRSPLSIIKGSADLVIREENALSSDQKYTLLSQIKTSSSDLLAIVNDILDVSKIESGRFEVKKVLGNINNVLREEANYYTALAQEKEITFEVLLDESLPSIQIDEDRIKHVMNNLLSNAVKFTENGGRVKITSNKVDDTYVMISVADTGKGVPDNMKGKLFNKFVQMENRKNVKEKGTGLGLVIAKGIVEAHGGTIWIEDNHPNGAIFVFQIPLGIA